VELRLDDEKRQRRHAYVRYCMRYEEQLGIAPSINANPTEYLARKGAF
jgi:hypothetical protein